tara:strand:+ start:6668 stop:6835 length:168 start_codon:yes stop_codon:yes gene_type:complete
LKGRGGSFVKVNLEFHVGQVTIPVRRSGFSAVFQVIVAPVSRHKFDATPPEVQSH